MTTSWDDLREDFKRVVFTHGVQPVADAIPCGRDTVYRIVHGTTKTPTHAVRAGVERIVRDSKD